MAVCACVFIVCADLLYMSIGAIVCRVEAWSCCRLLCVTTSLVLEKCLALLGLAIALWTIEQETTIVSVVARKTSFCTEQRLFGQCLC